MKTKNIRVTVTTEVDYVVTDGADVGELQITLEDIIRNRVLAAANKMELTEGADDPNEDGDSAQAVGIQVTAAQHKVKKPRLTVAVPEKQMAAFRKAIARWKVCESFAKKLREEDAADLQAVYDAIVDKDYVTAYRLADKLDTIVRDQIPTKVYDFIADAAGAG